MTLPDMLETAEYLTFRLGNEVFAFDIAKVREVLDYTVVTKIPRMPDYLRGVINLRSTVVPVVDLRLKFGMTKTEKTVSTCIIITEVKVDQEMTVLGVLADAVQEVMNLEGDRVSPAPKIGSSLNTGFIKGMGKQNEQFITILDIDQVFSAGDLHAVQATQRAEAA